MSLKTSVFLMTVTALVVGISVQLYRPTLPVPEVFGTVAPGFEEVREVFRKNYEDGWDNSEGGSAFSAYHKGEKVVDLWAGYADLEAKRLWREDTMAIIFSTTKGFSSVCFGILADRGLLDFKKPVSLYWPEFAQHGKENITVQQLLEHEAGLYAMEEPLSFDILRNHTYRDELLARTTPAWEPGKHSGYHGIIMGPYMDAIVRRVDPKGRTLGRFFDEEVRQKFDIDAYIGQPEELSYRVGRCVFVRSTLSHLLYTVLHFPFNRRSIIGLVMGSNPYFTKMMANCGELCEFSRMSDPANRKLEIASANAVSTARGIARMYGILANGGEDGNKTLLSHSMISEYVTDDRAPVPDIVWFDAPNRWKYGMDVIHQPNGLGNIFGASGNGGQIGYADPNNNIGYGFISRYMSPMGPQFQDPRISNLQKSVLRAVKRKQHSENPSGIS